VARQLWRRTPLTAPALVKPLTLLLLLLLLLLLF
jgi:hypothetical protein